VEHSAPSATSSKRSRSTSARTTRTRDHSNGSRAQTSSEGKRVSMHFRDRRLEPLCHRSKMYRIVLACEGVPADVGDCRTAGLRKFSGGKAVVNRHRLPCLLWHAGNAPQGERALTGGGALSRTNISTSCPLVAVKITENSSKGDTGTIPLRYRLAVSSRFLHCVSSNDTNSSGLWKETVTRKDKLKSTTVRFTDPDLEIIAGLEDKLGHWDSV